MAWDNRCGNPQIRRGYFCRTAASSIVVGMPLSIDSPEAAVAATPYLIGFTPQDSLVLLLLSDDGRLQVSLRVDLPHAGDLDWLLTVLHGIPEDPMPVAALLIAYADECPAEHAHAAGLWVMHVLLPVLDVLDVVLVAEDRYATLQRGQSSPAEGEPLADLAEHPIVAACVASGLVRLPSRDDLEAQMQPVLDWVYSQVDGLLRSNRCGDYELQRDRLEGEALLALTGSDDLCPADVAGVARACADVHVRDPLLAQMLTGEDGPSAAPLHHVRTRLLYCLVHTPGRWAGGVAATLALVAWADGDGAAALMAADRAQQADPANTLGPLVARALQFGMPPSTWAKLTEDIPLDVLRGRERRSA